MPRPELNKEIIASDAVRLSIPGAQLDEIVTALYDEGRNQAVDYLLEAVIGWSTPEPTLSQRIAALTPGNQVKAAERFRQMSRVFSGRVESKTPVTTKQLSDLHMRLVELFNQGIDPAKVREAVEASGFVWVEDPSAEVESYFVQVELGTPAGYSTHAYPDGYSWGVAEDRQLTIYAADGERIIAEYAPGWRRVWLERKPMEFDGPVGRDPSDPRRHQVGGDTSDH